MHVFTVSFHHRKTSEKIQTTHTAGFEAAGISRLIHRYCTCLSKNELDACNNCMTMITMRACLRELAGKRSFLVREDAAKMIFCLMPTRSPVASSLDLHVDLVLSNANKRGTGTYFKSHTVLCGIITSTDKRYFYVSSIELSKNTIRC